MALAVSIFHPMEQSYGQVKRDKISLACVIEEIECSLACIIAEIECSLGIND